MKLFLHPTIVALVALAGVGCDSEPNAEARSSAEVSPSKATPATALNGLLRGSPELSRDDLLEKFKGLTHSDQQEVRTAIDAAAKAPGVTVSYIHMAWSVESQVQQAMFADFALAWQRLHPRSPVSFRFLDCSLITSDYSSLHELAGWGRSKHTVGGYGEILWMKDGRVIDFGKVGDFSSIDALVEKAEGLAETSDSEAEHRKN